MKQRILNHVGMMVVLSVVLTFIAATAVMYGKYNHYMRQDVRNEVKYIRYGVENTGEDYLNNSTGNLSSSRITLTDPDGNIIYDSDPKVDEQENHKDRPEIREAMEEGAGEIIRYSKTLSRQTFYYAERLDNGSVLRVAKSTDSVLTTMLSSFTLLGVILLLILAFAFFVVDKQSTKLIAPINELDLEHPLEHVAYEELRPLLVRVDEQNIQIAKQVEELKQAEVVRKEFSANVSHELKTPLMSISGYAEIMRDGLVQAKDVPEFAGRIYDEASRLTNLVQDIIEISKLDERSEMPFEEVDLYELTKEICNTLSIHAKKKQIEIRMQGSPMVLEGVRHVLYEMLYNLVDNAIKYNKEGGYVDLSLREDEEGIHWSVEDSGIGIAGEEQERIFERFYRVDKSHSRQTGGTGLGLSIVKHGALLHHCKIDLVSEPGEGTRITLNFI